MNWSPRVKPIKIRRLYRYARLGIYDDMLLHDVGWALYARCADIGTVNDVYREGRVPCPQCRTKVVRQIDPIFRGGEGVPHNNWFHCPHCAKRLLWRDCRQALRDTPNGRQVSRNQRTELVIHHKNGKIQRANDSGEN